MTIYHRKFTICQRQVEEGKTQDEKETDPFAAVEDFQPVGPPWNELDGAGKFKRVAITFIKITLLLGLLYMFICSLSFLSSAFRLLGGKTAGDAFTSESIVNNPVAGLMIGVLATVLLQSSSTTTSIIVAMVASGILTVQTAIPMTMGANIGTSVTNTIVAIGQISDKNQFRRAFAGATVHDMFNLLCVVILLPLEVITGYLYHLSKAIVDTMERPENGEEYKKELLKKITKPFTNVIIQLDKKVIQKIAEGDESAMDKSLLKVWCDKGTTVTTLKNVTDSLGNVTLKNVTEKIYHEKCSYLFADTGMSDTAIGALMLVISLLILCICLVFIVKTLHSLLKGQIAVVIRKTFNSEFPKPFGFLTGYVAILVGAGLTILVQSSSIFTSALTPLVGMGIVSLDRIYPLTLGSNIGTTGTGILAALASSSDKFHLALQIALCHLFFNISGIIIWYPIPAMRRVPIRAARFLGNTTAEYRWFALLYLVVVFFLLPAFIFALSLAGIAVFFGILGPVVAFIIFIIIVNVLQEKKPEVLPNALKDWERVPKPLRSLEPYDRVFSKVYKKMDRNRTKSETVPMQEKI
ncbi:sodium-dependent phosphate transport protein 2B-like isoform X3 [Clytia hemisphaerica]|uniref:sodium-dependent phosphate transport protein 2B-like isoform X3 n=1 Tax=Clytia hemisphaerica TaxID=252671 RepID=UPI0034D7AAAD